MLYLFSSDTNGLYLQDVLDTLAVPNSLVFHYRYNFRWVSLPANLQPDAALGDGANNRRLETLTNAPALLIFVNQPADEHQRTVEAVRFYPYRLATVLKAETVGRSIHIYFKLGDYIDWRNHTFDDYHGAIRTALGPLPGAAQDQVRHPPRFYCTYIDANLPQQIATANSPMAEAAWESIIDNIGQIDILRNTIFYRVAAFRELRGRIGNPFSSGHVTVTQVVNNPGGLDGAYGYVLKSGRSYAMDLTFYRTTPPAGLVEESTILPRVQEALFAFTPDPISTNFHYDKRSIELITQPVNQATFTRLSLELQPAAAAEALQVEIVKLPASVVLPLPAGAAGAPEHAAPAPAPNPAPPQAQPEPPAGVPADPDVLSPQPKFVLKLTPPLSFFFGFLFLLAAQAAISIGSNIDAFASPSQDLTQAAIQAKQAGLALSLLGSAVSSIVLYRLLRRLPGS